MAPRADRVDPLSARAYGGQMPDRSRKIPRDPNQAARRIVDLATNSETAPTDAELRPKKEEREKDPAAVSLGRRGGLKGGKARADGMTPEERTEAAKKAAAARWGKPDR